MKKILSIYIIAICFSIFSINHAHASNLEYGYISGGYLDAGDDMDGYSIEASIDIGGTENGVYARALGFFLSYGDDYGSVAAIGNGDILFANVGYHWSLSDTADILLEGGYLGADITATACGYGSCYTESESESGYNIMAGFRSGNPDGFEFKFLLGRGDLVEAATISQLEIIYNFSEAFSFQIGSFYDGDDSSTMVGFRYYIK
jgi:hypothetical protein